MNYKRIAFTLVLRIKIELKLKICVQFITSFRVFQEKVKEKIESFGTFKATSSGVVRYALL